LDSAVGKLKDLLEDNSVSVMERAGSILMDDANLMKALAIVRRYNIMPLGLEGFHLDGERLTPIMEMIVDTAGAQSVHEAVDFIQHAVTSQGDKTLLYELIVA
jgi:hypothetical protein